MSLCDKANCFFGLLFLIQIGLSKSEGKPRATAPDAARDTGSYLPHYVCSCLQMTLRMPVCCVWVCRQQCFAVHSAVWQSISFTLLNLSGVGLDWWSCSVMWCVTVRVGELDALCTTSIIIMSSICLNGDVFSCTMLLLMFASSCLSVLFVLMIRCFHFRTLSHSTHIWQGWHVLLCLNTLDKMYMQSECYEARWNCGSL